MTKYTATWAGLSFELVELPEQSGPRPRFKTTGSGKLVRITLPAPKLVHCHLVGWALPVSAQLCEHMEAETTAALTLYSDERPLVVFEGSTLIEVHDIVYTWAFHSACKVSP